MSDLQWLFIVLAALYAWECACWLRRGSIGFCQWFGRWFIMHPGTLVGNQSGGFILSQPFPPLGALLTANQFPLSLSPDSALAWVSSNVNPGWRPTQSGRFVRFDDAHEIQAVGRNVLVNGEVFIKSSTPGYARWLAANLKKIAALKRSQRTDAITEWVRSMFDDKAAGQRWTEALARWRRVRLLSNIVILYMFLVVPMVIHNFGFKLSWLGLLMGLITLTASTAVLFWRSHRGLFPDEDDERFTHTLTILLAPTSAMRAHDVLSRPLLETFHPLVVAKLFPPGESFWRFARRMLLDMRYPAMPLCPPDNPDAAAAEARHRSVVLKTAEEFLKRNGLNLDELCVPPEPMDSSCHAYCPRCSAQFTTADATCADCGGQPLAPFSTAISQAR